MTHHSTESPTLEAALVAVRKGYHVFPLRASSKKPILPAGYALPDLSSCPGWGGTRAVDVLMDHGERWQQLRYQDGELAAGSYLSSRDPEVIERLLWSARVIGKFQIPRIGITSPCTCIDIDDASLVPRPLLVGLSQLPAVTSQSGGTHYFAAPSEAHIGGLWTPAHDHWGDVKHLRKTYSVLNDHRKLPHLSSLPELPSGVVEALREAHENGPGEGDYRPRQRSTKVSAKTGRRLVLLNPSSYWKKREGSYEPEELRGLEAGRHDYMLHGVGADKKARRDRRSEWSEALYEASRHDRARTRGVARKEVERAWKSAREPEPEPENAQECAITGDTDASTDDTDASIDAPTEPRRSMFDFDLEGLTSLAAECGYEGQWNRVGGRVKTRIKPPGGVMQDTDELAMARFWGALSRRGRGPRNEPWYISNGQRRRDLFVEWCGLHEVEGEPSALDDHVQSWAEENSNYARMTKEEVIQTLQLRERTAGKGSERGVEWGAVVKAFERAGWSWKKARPFGIPGGVRLRMCPPVSVVLPDPKPTGNSGNKAATGKTVLPFQGQRGNKKGNG